MSVWLPDYKNAFSIKDNAHTRSARPSDLHPHRWRSTAGMQVFRNYVHSHKWRLILEVQVIRTYILIGGGSYDESTQQLSVIGPCSLSEYATGAKCFDTERWRIAMPWKNDQTTLCSCLLGRASDYKIHFQSNLYGHSLFWRMPGM